MADIESNIDINIDASDAMAALKELQRQISVFNQQMQKSSAANAAAASNLRNNLINNINATGKFEARIATIKTTTESFTEALEKNKMSMGQYFRYAGGATKTFGKLFKKEFDTIETVARDRVKTLQTQYIKLGRDANGAMKAISVKPLILDMNNLQTTTAIAAQKQALLNQLLKQGSTQLLNFGKNTQWAGRQLMVGFTVPLTMLGTTASKTFIEMEKAVIKFKRVYGDLGTTMSDTDKMVQSVELLAKTFTKYGVAVKDTMQMAADAAAMGKTGSDLIAQITEASRLAVLGQVEQQQALETTMSLTNAFGTAAEDLGKKINFLNSVENQTATSIEDLTIAIPKAAPVIKQLGGDVEDLAFFLTAMKEGGINASEGANALKSGLASLINPTNKASEFLRGFGINVKGLVEANKGDVNGLVVDFAKALDTLDPLNRARAIEQMFGKFQFSRLSTLFQNVIKDGSQAQKVLEMTRATSEELAVLADRELKRVEDSPAFKFQKAMEDLKVALVPLGKAFLKAVTPLVEFATKILDQFNGLSDGAKSFVTNIVGIVGVIGPALLMGFGLVANGIANLIKLFTSIKTAFNNSGESSLDLAAQTEYMTQAQMEAAAVAASLNQTHNTLTQTLTAEASAIQQLTDAYQRAVTAQQAFKITSPAPVSTSNTDEVKGYAKGTLKVPGPMGAGDVVPAMLSPGESVIPRDKTKKYGGLINGIMNDSVPGFKDGVVNLGMPMSFKRYQHQQEDANSIYQKFLTSKYASMQPEQYKHQLSKTSGHSFPLFGIGGMYEKMDGTKVFVKPVMDEVAAEAESRGTQIARDAHGLKAPQQKIVVMNDPTDRENKRRFLALESPFDPTFAEIPETFSRGEYFKQLVASLLRGDKDLGKGNLGGSILADVGTAGVFTRASGDRALTTAMPSMEEQAIVNLLGIKGGAKKFFAQATADIARSMTPEEYDAAMKAEIQSVMPKLDSTIASFGNLNPEEQKVYEAMRQRLAGGLSTDWRRFQAMHSGVKMAMGGMIPGYNDGINNVKKESDYTPQEIYKLLKMQETHAFGSLDPKDPKVAEQLKAVYATSVPEDFKNFDILSNMTMSLPGKLNQQIKEGSSGVSGSLFAKVYNSLRGKLSKTAKMAGVPNMADAQAIEDQIGQSIATQQLVKDSVFAKVVQDTINNNTTRADSIGGAANLIWERTKQVGTIRSKMNETEGSATNVLLGMLQRKEATFDSSRQIRTPFGARIGRFNFDPFGSSSTEASEEEKALRANAQKAADQWIAAGDYSASLPVLTNSKGGQSRLSLRDNSAEPGLFNNDNYLAYDSKKKGFESDISFAPGGFSLLQGLGYFAEGTASVGATTGKPKASVFDIDDTLLDLSSFMAGHKEENEKLPVDQRTKWYKEVNKNPQPIPAGVAALKAAQQRGNKVILMTARPESYGPDTLETLAKLGIDMNGVDLIARQDKDYRKPHQMKYDKTSELMKQYDIEEFYDDMDETRGALGMLGINAINPLKLSKGAAEIGYKIFKNVDQSTLGMERFEDEKLGGTPGAMRMIDGKKHYVKQGFSEAETTSEVFSSALFSAMGNRGPQLQILDKNLVASAIIPGLIPSDRLSLMDWISKQPDQEMAARTVAQALKQYIENDVPFNAAIGNIDSHENNILFNPKTKKFENIDLGNSVLAGFTGIADFGSVAYDDTTRMKGDIYGAIRDTLGKNALDRIVRSVGLSRGATTPGDPRDASQQIDKIAQLLGFDLSLTSTTDPATDPINNKFIQQMIQENPELADKLNFGRQSSTSGKTFQESLQTLFTRMKRAKSQPVHFFNKGVFSVPGPKGAGDVVPAMLTPGEAVIPADKAEKHRGLITQMIYGKIPGYEDSNVIKPPGSIPGVRTPEPYMAPEPSKSRGFLDGVKTAISDGAKKMGDKLVESSKKAGEALVEKAKDAGEKVLGKVVDKYLNPNKDALVDSKGNVTNQATVDAREAEEAAQAMREEMAIKQRLAAQKLLKSEDVEYARLLEEQRNYDLKKMNASEASKITEQEKQDAIARNALIQQKEDLLLQEVNATTAEGQALRQRIAQSSGLDEEDIAALTTQIPDGPGDGKEVKTLEGKLKSFGGMMNKVGGVAFGANSIASMLPGEIGKQAQEMMIPIMSIAGALPMLQSPLGALTVVVTAAISAWAMYDGALKKGIETMVDLYDAVGSGTAAMRKFAEFTGKATAGEIMDKRREKKLNPFQIVPGKKTFGESFMESEQGKSLAKSYGDFLKTGATPQQARDQMANQLSSAVSTGAMTAAQARSVAVNLGKELKDYSFAVDVNAKVANLVGPNGENLAKEPLKVRMNLIAQTTKNVERSQQNLEKQGAMNAGEVGQVAGGAGVGLAAGAVAGLVAAPALLAMMGVAVAAGPVGWVVGAAALVGSLVVGVMSAASYAERLGKLAGANVALQKQALEQSQEMIDSLDLEYEKRIDAAKLAGDMAKAEDLTNQHLKARGDLLSQQAKLNQSIIDGFEKSAYKDQLKEGARKVVAKKYKDTVFEDIAPIAQQNIYDSAATDAQEQQLMLAMATDLDPTMVLSLLEIFGKDQKELTAILDIQTNYGSAFTGELTGIAGLFVDSAGNPVKALQTSLVAKVTAAGSYEKAQEILDTYAAITRTSDTLQVDVIVDTVMKNPQIEQKLSKLIDFISEQKGKINFDIVADTNILDAKSLEVLRDDIEFFNNIKTKEQQQAYLFTLITSVNAITDVQDPAVQAWLGDAGIEFKDKPPGEILSEYAIWNARRFAEISGDFTKAIGGDTGGGGPDTSWLDDFNKRIRDVLKWTHKMTQGWAASKKAIEEFAKTGMNMFDGLEMKLKRAGATDELTGAILGLSKEDYDKYKSRLINAKGDLTDFAKTLIKVTNQLAFGDAIVENDKIVLQAQTMSKAFSGAKNGMQSFIDKGLVTAADAYEILSDATIASAFAADKEGKSRKALVNSYMMAKKAQWLMLSADEKRQKYVDMYNANLEIISGKEDEINKKYDERTEALDKIQAANEVITRQNQVQLSLSEALAKGDLSGAVRAAKEMEALAASQAIEARRKAMEEARKNEIEGIEVKIGDALMTRKDIEDQIKIANDAIALSKASQLNTEIDIGKAAEANRSAVLAWAASKDNPASKNYTGGGGGLDGNPGIVNPVDPVDPVTPIASIAKIASGVKDEKNIAGGSALAGKLRFLSAGAGGFGAKNKYAAAEEKKNTALSELNRYRAGLPDVANRSKTQKETLGKLQKAYDDAKIEMAQYTEAGMEKQAKELLATLPADIQAAFTRLKEAYDSTERKLLVKTEEDAKETYDSTLRRIPDPQNRTTAESNSLAKKLAALTASRRALKAYDTANITPLRSALTAKGYGFGIKAFTGYASGGMVMPKYMSLGGFAMGTDTVPAMLTPGEFIVSQPAVEEFGLGNLKAINSGTYGGNSVYNYSVNVNAGSNASADDIARAVMNKINEVDSRRVRGNNF